MTSKNNDAIEDYKRQQIAPAPGDPIYLHLSDLLLGLMPFKTSETIRLLDFGCGQSPYASLYPNAQYLRADYPEVGDLDYTIDNDSRIKEADATFDLILSTQVAEHVEDPLIYFSECYRLLKKGGRLICSTHGTFPDHGCPSDFQRWTAEGLSRDLQQCGFTITHLAKLTTGPRALYFLLDTNYLWFAASRLSAFGLGLWFVRQIIRRGRRWIHGQCDLRFSENRVVTNKLDHHTFYIALLVVATKV